MKYYCFVYTLIFLFTIIVNIYGSSNDAWNYTKEHADLEESTGFKITKGQVYPDGSLPRPEELPLPIAYRGKYNVMTEQNKNDLAVQMSKELNLSQKEAKDLITKNLTHSMDGERSSKIVKDINKKFGYENVKNSFYKPKIITNEDLLKNHTSEYLEKLNSLSCIVEILGIPSDVSSLLSVDILNQYLLTPMKYQVQGTIDGVYLALKYGWAINLGGGFHHAEKNNGSDFCFFNDIALATLSFLEKDSDANITILDFDAHHGNGPANDLSHCENVTIADIYNDTLPSPKNRNGVKNLKFNYPASKHLEQVEDGDFKDYGAGWGPDSKYIEIVNKILGKLSTHKKSFIIYNAGTDIYKEDPNGCFCISKDAIIARDELVFDYAFKNKIPILMLLSGGYHKDVPDIVASSLLNLHTRGLICLDPKQIFEYTQKRMGTKIEEKPGFSKNQKIGIGAGIGILVITMYCAYYKINPIIVLKNLFNRNTN